MVAVADPGAKSWSRPGLSSYESYFNHFTDYLSPGNGLLSIEIGTLDLAGRGSLDFAPNLVYGEPFGFKSNGATYFYENYTGASLGYGWALNFPWLGLNYLHLADGQSFPYGWVGNTFQFSGVTGFVLISNIDGSYTLTMASGTVYQFDATKSLSSITDRTGNNQITFAYGTNNYISQVVDDVGRITTFSYNVNNQLVGISEGGRTWTLGYGQNGYSTGQLTTLTDPLSRVTTFKYVGTTGSTAWLISETDFPTGGKITHNYKTVSVGSEITGYLASSKTVYYDSTHISLSQSISTTIVNGLVTWSNSTISDGSVNRTILQMNFQSTKNLFKTYSSNGTRNLQRITEQDSDASGRTNATKIFSPSGSLLASSIYAYDSWGNQKYSKDNVGHETWFSYANTDSSNSFGTSGCNAAFFSQTISPSIHNLLVGRCDYQNGSGTPQQETFYDYDNWGNLLEQKTSHSGGWIYTIYAYDIYGNRVLASLPSATLPTGCAAGSQFGTGSDGSVTISSDTTLTVDKNYRNLTINSGVHLFPNSHKIYVCGTLTNNGYILQDGSSGSQGSAGSTGGNGAGGIAGGANDGATHTCTLGGGGGNGQNAGTNAGGGGGAWACGDAGGSARTGSGGSPGTAGTNGGAGSAGSNGVSGGSFTIYAYQINNGGTISASGGAGGGGGDGGAGGQGGAGGNGQAGSLATCGGGSGCAAGGGGGGNGGRGGNGANGGAGGLGANGGTITLYYAMVAGFGLGTVRASAGPGGLGGSAGAAGAGGNGGSGGSGASLSGACGAHGGGTGSLGGTGGDVTATCVGNSGVGGASGNSGSSGSYGSAGSSGSAGVVVETRNALANYTYYAYASTYSSAYLTKQSILVGAQNITTTYTYDSSKGFMLSQKDPNGQTTSYTYDSLGRLKSTVYPIVGGVTAFRNYTYDDVNNILTLTDENGHVTKQYFDGLARETKVERWNGSSLFSSATFTNNWLDAVASKTTAAGNTYTYSYDWNGRETKVTNPDTTYSKTIYDDVNNLKTNIDERGHKTIFAYNWNNWLTSVKQYNSTSNYYLTTYSYDLSGNVVSATDGKNQQTSYQYDDLNRLTTTTFPTSPSTTETRTYDSSGNLRTRTTANGSTIFYAYDGLNRMVKVTYPGSGGTVTYTYDADNNRLSTVNPSSTDYYTYDARSRVTNSTEYVGGVKYQTLYSYDKANHVVQITYPDSYVLSMTYDGVNRLKTVGGFATMGYTVDDKISKTTYGDGEITTYTYDSRDRPTRIYDYYYTTVHNKQVLNKVLDLNYTYDGTGNVFTINTNAETYHYDWLNRLNYTSGPWGTISYAYDQVGNRVRMVQGSTTTYSYGSFNRLSSAGTTTYTYDANGNTITKSGGWIYSYDYANRLVKVTKSGSTMQSNYYDGDGKGVKQVAGSSTFTYSYRGLNILYEKNVTGSTTTVTKHFYAGGLQVAKLVGTSAYYLHQDALGSTRVVATASVSIKFSSNYVPYGNNYGVTGKEAFMYTGKIDDSATGLYYFGARYYDPSIGRFVTQDSQRGNMNDPMTMNLYIYARDNPERYVDPTGHMFYSGRSWTDSDDPTFLATLTKTTSPSGNTVYVTTTATTTPKTSKMTFDDWFLIDFVHSFTFGRDLLSTVLDALSIFFPESRLISSSLTSIFTKLWTGGQFLDEINNLLSGNPAVAANAVYSMGVTLLTTWWTSVGAMAKLSFLMAAGGFEVLDAASVGTIREGAALMGSAIVGLDIINMFTDARADFTQYLTSQ